MVDEPVDTKNISFGSWYSEDYDKLEVQQFELPSKRSSILTSYDPAVLPSLEVGSYTNSIYSDLSDNQEHARLQVQMPQNQEELPEIIDPQHADMELDELKPIKLLGNGTFSSVILVKHNKTDMLYALKSINRKKIEAYDISNGILAERQVLLQLDHTFIVKLYKTFKDADRIYFLTEFVQGCELYDTIREIGLLSDSDARFYAGCIVEILQHIHSRDIIYRDLKPENIMIDDFGYPRLIDFGTAKVIEGRTYTIIGTPHYMAPEIINGKGYTKNADYWSLGVMIYEFICGKVPFGEDEQDPYNIYDSILNSTLAFPDFVQKHSPSYHFVLTLLHRKPGMRPGVRIGNLKEDHWFEDFNWDELLDQQIRPPYIPKLSPLGQEIKLAQKDKKTLHHFISSTEEPVGSIFMRSSKLPDDWDADFGSVYQSCEESSSQIELDMSDSFQDVKIANNEQDDNDEIMTTSPTFREPTIKSAREQEWYATPDTAEDSHRSEIIYESALSDFATPSTFILDTPEVPNNQKNLAHAKQKSTFDDSVFTEFDEQNIGNLEDKEDEKSI